MKFGPITNPSTGKTKEINVKPNACTIRDIAISTSMIIAGVAYLAISTFRNGATAYERAELETLEKLGLIN